MRQHFISKLFSLPSLLMLIMRNLMHNANAIDANKMQVN